MERRTKTVAALMIGGFLYTCYIFLSGWIMGLDHLYYLYSGEIWNSGPHLQIYIHRTSILVPIVDVAGLLVILGAVVYFRTYKPTNEPVVVARGKLIILVGFVIGIAAILVHAFGVVVAFTYPEAALQTVDYIVVSMMGDVTSLGIAIVAVAITAIGILVGGVRKGVKFKVP
ncbi:MAG: hypothetical protein EAX87_10000 [Candidatus Thorarchaeota archaeon]|nr:hypothetical protein [Candidatus Thorarchaeota archaeon]